MSEMFGCKAFRQFLEAEGLLIRASTQGNGTFPKKQVVYLLVELDI